MIMVSTTSTPESRYIATEERMWWLAALSPHLSQQYREVRALTGHSEKVRLAYYTLHESLIKDAFDMCSEDLIAARYHCEHILEEERLDRYHEACCHAILSTESNNPAYHARSAYEGFAQLIAEALNGDRVSLPMLVVMQNVNRALFGNVRRKEYDMMVGVARALQQEEAEQTARKVKEIKIQERRKKARRASKKKTAVRPRTQLSADHDTPLGVPKVIREALSGVDKLGLLQNMPSESELGQSSFVRKLRNDICGKAEEEELRGRTDQMFLTLSSGCENFLSKFADAIDSNMSRQQWDQEVQNFAQAGMKNPLVLARPQDFEEKTTTCSQIELSPKTSPALDAQSENDNFEQHPASPVGSDGGASVATLTLERFRHSPAPSLSAQDDTDSEIEQSFHTAHESVVEDSNSLDQQGGLVTAQVATIPSQEQSSTSDVPASSDETVHVADCVSDIPHDQDDTAPTPGTESDIDEDNDAMYSSKFLNLAWQKVLEHFATQKGAVPPGHENNEKDRLFQGIIVFLIELRKSWESSNDLDTPLTITDRAAFEERVNLMLEHDKKRNDEYEQQQAYQDGWDEIVAEEDQEKALGAALDKVQRVREEIEETHVTSKEEVAKLEREIGRLDELAATRLPEPQDPQEAEILQGIANFGLYVNPPESHRFRLTPEQKKRLKAAYPTEHPRARQRFRNSLFKAIPTGSRLLDELPAYLKSPLLKYDTYKMKGQQQEFEQGLHEHVLLGYHKLSKAMNDQIFLNMAETVLGPKEFAASSVLKENPTIVDAFLQHIDPGRLSAEEMERVEFAAPILILKAHKKFRDQLATGIPTGSRVHDELPPLTKTGFLDWDSRQNDVARQDQEIERAMPDAMRLTFQTFALIMAKVIVRNVVETVLGPEIAEKAVMVPAPKDDQTTGDLLKGMSFPKDNRTIVERFAELSIS